MRPSFRCARAVFAAAAVLAAGAAGQAGASQIGSLVQLTSTPTFNFSNLGEAGGTISASGLSPAMFVDQYGARLFEASLTLQLTHVGGNVYSGTFTITSMTDGPGLGVGDVVLGATIDMELSGANHSLTLNNLTSRDAVSDYYPEDLIRDIVGAFAFTNLAGNFDTADGRITGGGTANGTGSFAATPVPEPSTLSLLGLGLGTAGVVAHRRRRAGR